MLAVVVVPAVPVEPVAAPLVEQVRAVDQRMVKQEQTTPVAVVVETLHSATQPLWVAMVARVSLSSPTVHS